MEVTLLGTGDTTGTPTPGCTCTTCQQARERGLSRSRFSVHVHNPTADRSLLIDFSPDFRMQFLDNDVPLPDAGLVTHIHFDHLDGLGNIYRLVGDPVAETSFPVYAADAHDQTTDETIAETVRDKYGYLELLDVRELTAFEPTTVCGLDVTIVPVTHPPLTCFGVVIKDPTTGGQLSVSGDTSYAIPQRSRDILADPDLLLADGIVPPEFCARHPIGGDDYTEDGTPLTFGSKHMTVAGAQQLADDLDATQLRVLHVSHYYPADRAFDDPLAVDGETYTI